MTKPPRREKRAKMEIEADELLKTKEIETGRMSEADEYMKTNELASKFTRKRHSSRNQLRLKDLLTLSARCCAFDVERSAQKIMF
jgi:hypothetical protein